jgi:hypothetical protein
MPAAFVQVTVVVNGVPTVVADSSTLPAGCGPAGNVSPCQDDRGRICSMTSCRGDSVPRSSRCWESNAAGGPPVAVDSIHIQLPVDNRGIPPKSSAPTCMASSPCRSHSGGVDFLAREHGSSATRRPFRAPDRAPARGGRTGAQ